MAVGWNYDWQDLKMKFLAIAATCADGRPNFEQLRVNGMPWN